MSKLYISKTTKYNQLTAIERGKIEAYLNEGRSISWISKTLTRSKSTISYEVQRGTYNGKYRAHIAQNRAKKHRQCSHKHSKWRNYNLLIFIETRLKKRWSPEIISAL